MSQTQSRTAQILNDLVSNGILKTVDAPDAARPAVRESDIGPLLNDLRRIRDERDRLGDADATLSKQETAIKMRLLSYHETSGLDSISNEAITVSFKTELRAVPDKEKWTTLYEWAVATGNTHIFKREVVSKRVVELSDSGVPMPEGISFTSFTNVNIRRKGGGNGSKSHNDNNGESAE